MHFHPQWRATRPSRLGKQLRREVIGMAEVYYNSPRRFDVGNVAVALEVNRLKQAVKRDLRNYFSNYSLERETGMFEGVDIPAGAIEDIVVRRGLKSMRVGNEDIQFTSNSPIDDYPDIGMGDEEDDIDLYEEVLKTIVDRNRFLARQYPFNLVFAQYLALVNQEKKATEQKAEKAGGPPADEQESEVGPDPTTSPQDTSTVQRISGSELSQAVD